jgi:cold shock CspA family protein
VKGIIKKWFRYRGFGYIEPEEGYADVFCHVSEIKSGFDPLEGQKVQFAVVPHWKWSRAEECMPIELST